MNKDWEKEVYDYVQLMKRASTLEEEEYWFEELLDYIVKASQEIL